jgi:hypothetical protein
MKNCFYWTTQNSEALARQAYPQSVFLLKSKDWKLDLGSLDRLFQNRPKDKGLVGDRCPLGPPEG